jgi:hypothetical protein
MFHQVMPFLYYCRERPEWCRRFVCALFERSSWAYRRTDLWLAIDMARSFLEALMARIDPSGSGGVWRLDVSSDQRAERDWIFFEGQLGP